MKILKKLVPLLLAFCMLLGVAGCAAAEPNPEPTNNTNAPTATDNTNAPTTPDNNQDTEPSTTDETKPVLLVVSFGTSYNETRDITIGAIETALQNAYPEYEIRRAFTAQTIIDILKDRENLDIDNVTQAMSRLVVDGVKDVVIQPTHVIPGAEYNDILDEIASYANQFDSMKIGKPLLSASEDYDTLIASITEETASYNVDGTAIVFMGHGTHHEANSAYTTLQEKLIEAGYTNYFIGTVEAAPSLDDVMALVEESGAKKVVLLPLMIVAGDHATNDMASDEEDSWKTAFINAGYEVECVLKGLGEYSGIQQMVIDHAKAAMESPDPIVASQIADGTYALTNISSSSSMFKIVKCDLTVADGEMRAVITMSGDGYDKVFVGTGEEAAAASEDTYIPAVSDSEGAVTFEVPLEALNVEMDLAAWSVNKEKWYDRTLVFYTDGIPTESITVE